MQNILLDLTVLALLLFLFGSVNRVVYDRKVRFWLLGWIAVFLFLVVDLKTRASAMLLGQGLQLLLFTFTGMCFLFSFLPRMPRTRLASVAALFAVPATSLIFLSLFAPAAFWPICGAVIFGEVLAIIVAQRLLVPSSGHSPVNTQISAVVGGALMLFAAGHMPRIVPYLVLAQFLLLAGLALWTVCSPRQTRGCVAAVIGLILWAMTLPVRFFLETKYPGSIASFSGWDLSEVPVFLTAFGMSLILFEESIHAADTRAEDYRKLFDSHPLPMYIYDMETLRFVRVNEAAIQHYGYTAEEFAAMTIEDIRPASELPRLRKILAGERRAFSQTHGWRHLLKNGRVVDVDVYRHWLQFEGRRCNMVLALDVTQRNAAERRLSQTYKLESLGQLTSGIAHDFNNLLAILMGSLELVDRHNPAPSSRALIQQAILSVRRGTALTSRLLAYSRNLPVEASPVSVHAIVDSIAPFLRTSLGPAITLDILYDPGLWQAGVDPNQLENAVLNLTLNARDAMPDGGSLHIHAGNVTIHGDQANPFEKIEEGDYILLTLTDTGSGMPADVLARATEPFFSTKPAGAGTGLGLNMVSSFLQQAGGSLQIESDPSVGTSIHLYLPRADPSASIVSVPEAIEAQPIPRGNEVLLLVEDEPTIRHIVGILLRSLGYTVHDAADASTALTHLQNDPQIALLVTDVILPRGLDGVSLAERARALQPTLQVLFSSGYTREVLRRQSRIPEDAQLLTKPYQVADLAQQVRQALSRPVS